MSAPQQSSQTAAAVGNALRGEPAFKEISFPLTGDQQIDAISGCLAVLRALQVDFEPSVAVCRYLAERHQQMANEQALLRRIHNPSTVGLPIGSGFPPPFAPGQPLYDPAPGTAGGTYPWGATGGTSVLDDSTKPESHTQKIIDRMRSQSVNSEHP